MRLTPDADLHLVARHVLAGLGAGLRAGREHGSGIEFAEYRAWVPGDDARRIDWKLMARADRYYVREAERDSHVAVWLWLDASASMAEPSRATPGLDKLGYARALLACMAALAQRQGDAVGLLVSGGGTVHITPPARGAGQLRRVLGQLERTRAAGLLPERVLPHFARTPSLVFAASDCLDWPSAHAQALLRLRRLRHDVRLLCLHTEAERAASFAAGQAWSDPERPRGLVRFDSSTRPEYRRRRDLHFADVATDCRRHDIPLVCAAIEEPLVAVLRKWLRP